MHITKIFTFDAAHMLNGHDGKCRNLHGHTYRLEVTIIGSLIEHGSKKGMVMDFADLKTMVRQTVIHPFDHAFIYHSENTRETQLAALLESWNMKTLRLNCRTTAENLAIEIYNRLQAVKLPVCNIVLWETPSSCVQYRGSQSGAANYYD